MKKILLTFAFILSLTLSALPSKLVPEIIPSVDVVSAATSTPAPKPEPVPTPEPVPEPTPIPTPDPVVDNISSLNNYSAWAESELEDALEQGLIPETLTGDLSSPLTRLEYATLAVHFYEMETGEIVPLDFASPFTDTQDENVLKSYALGITSGIGNGHFNPDGLVTRQEIATFIYRTLTAVYGDMTIQSEQTPYDDMDSISDWAKEAVHFTHHYQIIKGTDEHHFSPQLVATDEMAIIMLERSLDHVQEYEEHSLSDNLVIDEDMYDEYDDDMYDDDDEHDDD